MNLEGKWENEHGSKMCLTVNQETGIIEGTYKSQTGAIGEYRVVGMTDTHPREFSQTVAFAISWRPTKGNNEDETWHWVSGFTGQLQLNEKGEEVLTTTFLLQKDTKMADNWESTLVDKSTFRRLDE